MDILITGGTVFASRYTAEYFSGKGHTVYVLNRGSRPQVENVIPITCDRHQLGDTLKSYRFDAVLDITAYNRGDVSDLLAGLGDFGTYILISSSAVYPETLPQPFREEQVCGANSIWGDYGIQKLAAERFVLENIENSYILRPPYLYGPMNNLYREAFVFGCAENDLPFYLPQNGTMPLQFFHIRDLCRFMEILLEKQPAQRIFNTGNPNTITVRDWVTLCYRVLDKEPDFRHVDKNIPQRSYFPFYDYAYVLDVQKQSALMPNVLPLYEGLCESYGWYRQNRSEIRRKPLLDFIAKNLSE